VLGEIMLVKEIMKKVVNITQEHTLREAAKLMAEHSIGCLVVTEGDALIGIVTERDILKQVSKGSDALDTPVKNIMSTNVITIGPDMHIDDAAELMSKHKIKKLPVYKDNQLMGIITSTDLVSNCEDFGDFSLFD
jgi:CBS domain-containing protein